MILADADVLFHRNIGDLEISPWDDRNLQAASYDVTLGPYWRFPWEPETTRHEMTPEGFDIPPGEFILLHTEETIRIGNGLVGFVCGKSSRAREGFQIESAGLVDPGFEGQLVLEVKNLLPDLNVGTCPDVYRYENHLRVKPEMKIAQIWFARTVSKSRNPYSAERNHYFGQMGPVGSRTRA